MVRFWWKRQERICRSDNLYVALWKGLSNEEPAKGVCGASVSQSPLSDRDMREEKAKGKWQKPVLPTKRTGWLCASVRLYKRIWRSQKRKMKVVKRIIKGKTGAITPHRPKWFYLPFQPKCTFHQKRAIIIRCSKILFLSLGRRWHTQRWCAP